MLGNVGRHLLAACLVASLAAISASSAADETTPAQTPKPYPEGITCVWMPVLDSYSLIDDEHIVFQVTRKRSYLLTLTRRCSDLDTSLDVKLQRRGSQLCTGDSIITETDRCSIRYVEEVTNLKEAKSIVEARDAAENAERQGASGN